MLYIGRAWVLSFIGLSTVWPLIHGQATCSIHFLRRAADAFFEWHVYLHMKKENDCYTQCLLQSDVVLHFWPSSGILSRFLLTFSHSDI